MLTRENAITSIIAADPEQNFPVMASSDVELLINQIYDEHEAQMKAKDDEIERLNCRAYHAEGYINDLHNHPKDKKFYNAKARSIVAMLFWKWRKAREAFVTTDDVTVTCYCMFETAKRMLKDNA